LNARPTICAIIAVKDGEAFLADAIDSIISQSYPGLQLLVVDGGSTDRSAEMARSYEEVTLIEQRGEGLSGAWNQGVEASSGDLIGFIDSDDVWLPGKLDDQVELLEGRPDLAGANTFMRFALLDGAELPSGVRPDLLDRDHPGHMPGTLLVRREVFDQIGNFDPAFELAMDVDWFARVKDAGLELGMVQSVLLEKRFHEHNLSHRHPDLYNREMAQALGRSVRRQRSEQEAG
jgi:glycosyltransferase involved in cell wall biosynthesis